MALGALALVQPAHADTEKRVALVIGNAGYKNVPRLANSNADAQLVAKTLRELGFTLVGGGAQLDLDHAGFARAVHDFGDAIDGSSVALFYYAGHGIQMQGENWLVPVDANPVKPSDADFQLIATASLLHVMQDSGSRLNLVILDACRNNPFGGRGLRDLGAGLAQMQAPKGTLLSYATQPGNVALDGPAGGNGPFALALTQAMRQPGLDVLQTFNQVGLIVAHATQDQQQPWQSSSPVEGKFFFALGDTDDTKRARQEEQQLKAQAEAAQADAAAARAQAQAQAAELAKARAEAEQAKAEAAAAKAQAEAEATQARSASEDVRKQAADALAKAQAQVEKAQADASAAAAQASELGKVKAEAEQAKAEAAAAKAQAETELTKRQQVSMAAPQPAPAPQPSSAAVPLPGGYAKAPPPGACPAPGTKLLISTGAELTVIGSAGLACSIVSTHAGTYQTYGLAQPYNWTIEDNRKQPLAALWPLEVGKRASYTRDSGTVDSYHVDRKETVTTPAGTFDTFVLIKEATGTGSGKSQYRDTISFYISTELGFIVKWNYEVMSGVWRNAPKPWDLVSITPPGAQIQQVAATVPQKAKPAAPANPSSVLGRWIWFNPTDSDVAINPDGTAVHYNNGTQIDSGNWVLVPTSGRIRILWRSGNTDEWLLSADGLTMDGINQKGGLPSVHRE